MRGMRLAVGLLMVALIVLTARAQVILTPDRPREPTSLLGRIAAHAKMEEEDVTKVIEAFGPAIRDHLAAGNVVEIPNLGRFRVVRIPEHRDMVNGRPATIPSNNYVEFLPAGSVIGAANAPTARPAETVPAFEYNPLPGQTPGFKMPNQRMPATRTR